ncbi:MAG: ABC transporter ATP-binding protein, partial [Armatimonadetes bacterium]|nr:ABC transporter ATP-binding protein [Armatimonadota bacterium]
MIKGAFLYVQAYMMAYGNNATIKAIRRCCRWRGSTARTGDVILRLTDDIRVVTDLLAAGIIMLLNDVLVSFGAVTYMIVKNPIMTLLAFFLTPVTAWLIDKLDRRVETVIHSAQDKEADLTSQMEETISGIRVVKAFGREDYEEERYREVSTESYNLSMRVTKMQLLHNPMVEIISTISLVIVIGYGAYAVANKHLTLGEFMAFWGYLLLASTPLTRITNTISNLRRGLLAARRIFELKDIEPEVHDREDAIALPPAAKSIAFENVTFRYVKGQHAILDDVSFEVPYGTVTTIVGHNGAGKSTLISLIPRFYDPESGRIAIDGIDLREARIDSLRRQIGFVLQDNILFSGSLRDNLKYGNHEATDAEMLQAAEIAHCHEFISKLPDGYDTMVPEG